LEGHKRRSVPLDADARRGRLEAFLTTEIFLLTSKTGYQLKQQLLDDYLRKELANPSLAFT
jgi:hypothetical protein